MIHAQGAEGTSLQFAEVTAVIKRGDGTIEHRLLESYESDAHRTQREAMGLELPAPTFNGPPDSRLVRGIKRLLKLLPFALIGAMACAHPQHAHCIPAATVITNAGQAIVTNLVSGLGGTVPKFVMWGTGAGTAAVTDTALFTETTDEARTSGTVTRVTTTVTNDTYQVVGTITVATAGKTITNVGLFDVVTSVSGNLYFKSDFTGLALSVADSITFTIKVKFA